MENLSHLLPPNPVAPTSQHAGNTTSDNSAAMTAPGTANEGVMPADIRPVPALEMIDHPPSVLVDGHGSPSPSPWTDSGTAGWAEAADETPGGGNHAQTGPWDQT